MSKAAGSVVPFALAVFASATLVFTVQPMIAKLVLPLLGGSSSVWNTCLVFFQLALLAGYAYAHFLQKIAAPGRQAIIHLAVLLLSALVLPIRISDLFGDPWTHAPSLWLLLVLAASIGPAFATLSATAPLVQAWRARTGGGEGVWSLYAASNLGSLLALLAYPVLIEPNLDLQSQRWSWSAVYLLFAALMAYLAWKTRNAAAIGEPEPVATPLPARAIWLQRLTWIALAALPSSLMLGLTVYLTTDVASAPFLWVAPLALYLLTFIIAFQSRPLISPQLALTLQISALIGCVGTYPFHLGRETILPILGLHMVGFFLTALVFHQALAAKRPETARLTDFYLCLAIGGVVGGAFNAFLAPLIFNTVVEYPAALVLAALARPWRLKEMGWQAWLLALPAPILAGLSVFILTIDAPNHEKLLNAAKILTVLAGVACLMAYRHGLILASALAVLSFSSAIVGDQVNVIQNWRSFFGVLRMSTGTFDQLGEIRMLAHGTTLHGAQAADPRWRCRPMVYYGDGTPIGQVFVSALNRKPSMDIGVVGLGTGAISAYTRPGDRLTFYEIDPLVVDIARDPANFTYVSECAGGKIDYVLGDARLTLEKEPEGRFDLLLIDAFSSDAIPAHLLTVEALKSYLARLKPDGVLILHLSNRNLELRGPAQAGIAAAGGRSLFQHHVASRDMPILWESDEDAVIGARSIAALAPFVHDERWTALTPEGARAWTDDYTNIVGAIWARLKPN